MSIIKNTRKNPGYVQVYNEVLEDTRLSLKAKGLLAYLTSKPENWVINEKDLYNKSMDGFTSIRSAIKELKMTGYAQVINTKNSKGVFISRELVVTDIPLFWEGYRKKENLNKIYTKNEVLLTELPDSKEFN